MADPVAPLARIVGASGNAGKRREIARILGGFEILSLDDFPGIRFPEEGGDYFENACAKALVAARETGLPCVADDSGLEVDALGGAPGPFSARFGGAGLDDRERIEALLAALRERAGPRTARFFCVAACALPDGHVEVAEGSCPGRILETPEGSGGFGYDPIFRPDGFDRPMAGLTREEKDAISHRGQAFRRLEPVIRRLVRRTDG